MPVAEKHSRQKFEILKTNVLHVRGIIVYVYYCLRVLLSTCVIFLYKRLPPTVERCCRNVISCVINQRHDRKVCILVYARTVLSSSLRLYKERNCPDSDTTHAQAFLLKAQGKMVGVAQLPSVL
jgi:hypothetical protein